ncbi:hypothetical protein SLS62_007084 [Diatrype stigma]|uniref:Uncharacterized protein n=1 Tax=Diatrype stigma TaxID=117547 RepID=A0AAN9YNL4_9PEZI
MPDRGLQSRGFPLRLVQSTVALYIGMFLLDVGTLIVSVMAYSGAHSEDDRPVIQRTYITFPAAGYRIQRAEIALVSAPSPLRSSLKSSSQNVAFDGHGHTEYKQDSTAAQLTQDEPQPSLGIIVHGTLMGAYAFLRGEAGRARSFARKYPLPWHTACVVAWAVLAAYQADYVPALGRGRLPECVKYGSELSQCGMVTASWVLAIANR